MIVLQLYCFKWNDYFYPIISCTVYLALTVGWAFCYILDYKPHHYWWRGIFFSRKKLFKALWAFIFRSVFLIYAGCSEWLKIFQGQFCFVVQTLLIVTTKQDEILDDLKIFCPFCSPILFINKKQPFAVPRTHSNAVRAGWILVPFFDATIQPIEKFHGMKSFSYNMAG